LTSWALRIGDAIERQLAREELKATRQARAGAEYRLERVAMMQTWVDYLDELRLVGKIIRLRRENS
jgi:hypothetical protein